MMLVLTWERFWLPPAQLLKVRIMSTLYTETPPNLVRVTDHFKSISLGASTNTSRSKSDASTLADDRSNISTLTPDWFNVTGPKTRRTSSGIPLITLNERYQRQHNKNLGRVDFVSIQDWARISVRAFVFRSSFADYHLSIYYWSLFAYLLYPSNTWVAAKNHRVLVL